MWGKNLPLGSAGTMVITWVRPKLSLVTILGSELLPGLEHQDESPRIGMLSLQKYQNPNSRNVNTRN